MSQTTDHQQSLLLTLHFKVPENTSKKQNMSRILVALCASLAIAHLAAGQSYGAPGFGQGGYSGGGFGGRGGFGGQGGYSGVNGGRGFG
ncbi:unnamed protein product, partial [Allacma fusca]